MLAVLKVTVFRKDQQTIGARLICPRCPRVQGKTFSPEEIATIVEGIDPSDTDAIRLAILNHHLDAGFSLVIIGPLDKDSDIEVREYYLGLPQVYKEL